MDREIIMDKCLMKKFVMEVKTRYPLKAFGYFLTSREDGNPDDFIMFEKDVRNEWKQEFETYGEYYVRNEDAGFLATPEETYIISKKIRNMGKRIVGVFHSHQRHPAIFSTVDIDLHPSKELWHIIISLRNYDMPQIKAFSVNEKVEEIKIIIKD